MKYAKFYTDFIRPITLLGFSKEKYFLFLWIELLEK